MFVLFLGILIFSLLVCVVCLFGKFKYECFYYLSLSLILLVGCGVFVGLLVNIFIDLEKYVNMGFMWIIELKVLLLIGVSLWSMMLVIKMIN